MTYQFLPITLLWLAGTWIRVYRQARFFQIEEYMTTRYLRWYFATRERWFPRRPAFAWLAGIVLGITLNEVPGNILLLIFGSAIAIIGVWPPDEGEIKKPFKPTSRAKRLLAASFIVATFAFMLYLVVLGKLPLPQISVAHYVAVSLGGIALYLAAPFTLIFGNLLMQPIEALFRGRFINKARKVLAEIDPVVVGITGSYGKTTTKTFLAHILGGRYKVYPTPKSYNTIMGVCLAINRDLAEDHSVEYFVCEMGAYIPGEIQQISDLTQPTISIVVEVGPQHLERFGSLENIAVAKYEIIKALPPDGVGVFNWDNPYIRHMYERGYPQTRLAVSRTIQPSERTSDGPRFIANDISESLEGLRFTVTDTESGEQEQFLTTLLGEHNVTNILLATAVAVHEGMKLREVAYRVRGLKPAESRLVSQTDTRGITIINDAYSANPAGIVSALKVLSLHQNGRRLLITPGMVELGMLQESENQKLGELAAHHATDVILVGTKQTEAIKSGLISEGFASNRIQVVEALAESIDWYQNNLESGDTVLFLNDLPDTYSS